MESYILCQPHFRNIQWYRELAVILDEVLERPIGQSDDLIEYTLDWVSSCVEKKERLVEGLKTLEEPPPWGVVEVDANSLYPMCPTPGGSIHFSSSKKDLLPSLSINEKEQISKADEFGPDSAMLDDCFTFHEHGKIESFYEQSFTCTNDDFPEVNLGEDFPTFKYFGVIQVDIEYCGSVEKPFTSVLCSKIGGELYWDLKKKSSYFLCSHDLYMALKVGWIVTKYHHGVFFGSNYSHKKVIKEIYDKRKELKKNKNSSETVYKLNMNSFYGSSNMKNVNKYIFGTRDHVASRPGKEQYSKWVTTFTGES